MLLWMFGSYMASVALLYPILKSKVTKLWRNKVCFRIMEKSEKEKVEEKEKEEGGVDEVEMDRLMALEYHQKAQVVEAYSWQFL